MSDQSPIDMDSDDDILASEYVLGLLTLADHTNAEARIAADPAFAARIEAWNERLQPLAEAVAPVAPPARAWSAIAARITPSPSPAKPGLWDSLAFWRVTAMGGLALAAALAWIIVQAPQAGPATLVAALNPTGAGPAVIARIDLVQGRLTVQAPQAGSTATVPELWLIPADGKPRALGVIPAAGVSEIALSPALRQDIQAEATLAISLEPPGGSPTGQPTGPVIASGKI